MKFFPYFTGAEEEFRNDGAKCKGVWTNNCPQNL
jgi:hypothetical protein